MLMPLEDHPISKGSVLVSNTWTPLLGSAVVGSEKEPKRDVEDVRSLYRPHFKCKLDERLADPDRYSRWNAP
jgi:hypothetical protein